MYSIKVNFIFSTEILPIFIITSSIKSIALITLLLVLSQINSQISTCLYSWILSVIPLLFPQDNILDLPIVQREKETYRIDLNKINSLEEIQPRPGSN